MGGAFAIVSAHWFFLLPFLYILGSSLGGIGNLFFLSFFPLFFFGSGDSISVVRLHYHIIFPFVPGVM